MDTEKTNAMIMNLASKRQALQQEIRKRREKILDLQEDVAGIEEKVQEIDANIAKIKVRASREEEKNKDARDANDIEDGDTPLEVEEDAPMAGDGAISTAALSAASTSTGGDFGGWRHYSKVGDTQKRSTSDKKKKKKKKFYEYMDSYWDLIEEK